MTETIAVLHFRKAVLVIPAKHLLASEPLIAHGHVGVVVKAVCAADAVHSMEGPGIAAQWLTKSVMR